MEAAAAGKSALTARFFPVHIDSVCADTLEMDLYIRYGTGEPTLYRARGVDFNEPERERLVEQRVEFLYVPMAQHSIYRQALNRRLEGLFRASEKGKAERGRLLRAACVRMVDDLMYFPGNAGAIGAVEEVGRILARFMQEDESGFCYILDMSEHDYYTTTHMVNVGVGCGMLVAAVRPDEHELIGHAIQGGLLHDIGKRGVSVEILNKESDLTSEEWAVMRQHPVVGYEELQTSGHVHPVVLEMTRDHHERLDGTGYPNGISGEQVGFAARVCAIVDVYDAITAARPYRGATPPFDVLRSMAAEAGTLFDADIFSAWSELVERLVREDPERVRGEEDGAKKRRRRPGIGRSARRQGTAMEEVVRAATAGELPERIDDAFGKDRRVHVRKPCDLVVAAVFIRQMKEYGLPVGERFNVCIRNISRGGVLIETPWPLSLNDLLSIELPGGEGHIARRIRIVRVRLGAGNRWTAGACFIAEEKMGLSEAA